VKARIFTVIENQRGNFIGVPIANFKKRKRVDRVKESDQTKSVA